MKFLIRLMPLGALMPFVALAQFGKIDTFFDKVLGFINDTLVPLVFAIAFLVFIWGIFQYFILGGGDPEKRKDGQQLMLWAIIGFVVMVSVWGIVNVVSDGLDFNDENLQTIPNVPRNN